MARTKKTNSAITGRLQQQTKEIQKQDEHTEPNVHEEHKEQIVSTVDNVHNESTDMIVTTRKRTTVKEPGAKQGLQPGWTRVTFIVRDDLLKTLRDYAYTERITVKDVLEEALQEYFADPEKTRDLKSKPQR